MDSLRTFLNLLRSDRPGDLVEVDEPVSRNQEMTAYWEHHRQHSNPTLLFKTVKESPFPLVTNLFSTRDRIGYMLGTDADGVFDEWNHRTDRRIDPVTVDDAPVQASVRTGDDCRPGELPIPQYFRQDAGRYVSAGIVVAASPEDGVLNLSFARMQLMDERTFGISVHSRGNLWEYLEQAKQQNRPHLEVAVVIGCHPLAHLAAATRTRDEYPLLGALTGEPVELVRCRTSDLLVPSNAEFVLEGRIPTDETVDEGPFSEYTGFVTGRSTNNVFKLDALTHRDDPLFHGIIPSNSSEHLLLGGITKQAFVYSTMVETFPRIKGIRWPAWGTHFVAIVSLDKSGEDGIQNRIAAKLMAEDYYLKYVILVDPDVDIHLDRDVFWAIATRSQPEHAAQILRHTDGNILDPSQREAGLTSRMILDATTPSHMDKYERPTVDPEIMDRVRSRIRS